MSKIIFNYNNIDIEILSEQHETISSLIQKFCTKSQVEKKNLTFICNGNALKEDLTVDDIPERNGIKSKILVESIEEEKQNENCLEKSDIIICPECKEVCLLSIKDYKVNLYECKNGHKSEGIFLSKFKDTQNIDISKISCGLCKKTKNNISGNQLYKCIECKINLCPICNSGHNQSHNKIRYEEKYYKCEKDGRLYNVYCKDCKKNLCSNCESDHLNHNLVTFGRLKKNKFVFLQQNEILKNSINQFKNTINGIKEKLDRVADNLEIYLDINNTLLKAFNRNNDNNNAEELISINDMNSDAIISDINKIINESNVKNQMNRIGEMYQKMEENVPNNQEIMNINLNQNNNVESINKINNEVNQTQNMNNNINIILEQPNNVNSNNNNIINTSTNNNNINTITNNTNNMNNININNNNNINTNTINSCQTPIGDNNNRNNNYYDNSLCNNMLNNEYNNLIIEEFTPLISDDLDIKLLIEEYQDNSQYLPSVKKIVENYKSIRRIRLYGNCFYLGFIYRLFEHICLKQDNVLYEKMLKKLDEGKEVAKRNESQKDMIQEIYNTFYGEFCSCYNSLSNRGISSREYIDKLFDKSNKEKCNYFIFFIRFIIAEYLRMNSNLYQFFFNEDYNNWIRREVESLDREVDEIQILACANFFDVGVKIERLEKDKVVMMKYPEDKNEGEIFINFMFMPGHYDLLYPN